MRQNSRRVWHRRERKAVQRRAQWYLVQGFEGDQVLRASTRAVHDPKLRAEAFAAATGRQGRQRDSTARSC